MERGDCSDFESFDELDYASASGSDYEVELKSKKRRKRITAQGIVPPKRPRQRAAQSASSSSQSETPHAQPPLTPHPPLPRETTTSGAKGKLKGGGKAGMTEGHSASGQSTAAHMYEAVRSGRSALVTVVDEWLEDYKQDQKAGLLELINFVVQCCGCKGVVNRQMLDTMQNAEIIRQLTKEFNEDSVNYPLCSVGAPWRRFREGLCEFVALLVRRCQNSLLYDEFLFSSLLALLTGLTDSQVRAFRHTSTLIAMKLMSAVVVVATELCALVEMTARRCDLEKRKGAELRAAQRVEELESSYGELLEHQEELRSLMNGMFKGVFVHRYRDHVPEIRAICMEELGLWLREFPTSFLNDGHLKYLGWMLHDKQASVRLQCVLALQQLYQEKDFVGRLELFTSRFKERMLNMALDKDSDVVVEAVKLLLLIHQGTEEGLSEEECNSVLPLVFASHRRLASAAGQFLYHMLSKEVDQVVEAETAKRSDVFFNLLTSFFIQCKYHEHGAYLVDSLWDVCGAELRDWETMTSLLLQESGGSQALTDKEEGALIELMMCAVRQAAEATPPVPRSQGRKNLSMRDKKVQAQDRRRITTHFIPLLPQLLAKFSADVEKVRSLLRAPLHFDLEAYGSTGRLEKCVEQLLAQVCEIVEKHADEGVLEACARVACVLCDERYTFSGRAHTAIGQLLDRVLERFTSHLTDLLGGTADEEQLYSAATSLKRIAIFSSARDLTAWKLFEPCSLILKCGVESREVETELMAPALTCAAFHLLWTRVNISNTSTKAAKPPLLHTQAELKRLQKEVRSFCTVCQSCLSLDQAQTRDKAFDLLCDLLLVFSEGGGAQPEQRAIAYSPDDSLRADLAFFLLDYVFTEQEDEHTDEEEEEQMKLAGLQRRRKQLAGYCKLLLHSVLGLRAASDVFRFYSKFYRDYGDIIKETLSKSKMIHPVESAKAVCLSLQQLFSELDEHKCKEDVGEIRELAKKLAMSFGINLHRIRKPLLALHQDGICFAFRDDNEGAWCPTNVTFLEILSEFSFKLIRQDRTQLLAYLQRVCGSLSSESVRMYERSLRLGSRETPAPTPLQQTPARKRRKTSTRGVESVLESSALSSLATPVLTSTAQRQVQLPRAAGHLYDSPGSFRGTASESEEDFTDGSLQRGRNVSKGQSHHTSSEHSDIGSQLNMLSLIEEDQEDEDEDDEVEEEAPVIEEFKDDNSDLETALTLLTTRHSTSFLEDLFE